MFKKIKFFKKLFPLAKVLISSVSDKVLTVDEIINIIKEFFKLFNFNRVVISHRTVGDKKEITAIIKFKPFGVKLGG